ncbi:MAG: hypothetical protein NZ518_01225, partial [Dehalococcoidia bacterium]|nr:hypothetical protein [Dehalococcoidia bacterium]
SWSDSGAEDCMGRHSWQWRTLLNVLVALFGVSLAPGPVIAGAPPVNDPAPLVAPVEVERVVPVVPSTAVDTDQATTLRLTIAGAEPGLPPGWVF